MKFVIAIALIAALALTANAKLSDEQKEIMKKAYTKCVASSGVDKELITKGRKGEFTENAELMQYYTCVLQELKMQDADGTLHPQTLIDRLPDNVNHDEGVKIIKKCVKNEPGVPPHRVAFNVYKCFVTTANKEIKFF